MQTINFKLDKKYSLSKQKAIPYYFYIYKKSCFTYESTYDLTYISSHIEND